MDQGVPANQRLPIKLLIHTPGGYLQETYSMVDTILSSTTPVITVNMGTAYSGGCLLLLAGSKRYALPHSKALIHTGSGGTAGTYEQVEEQQKVYRKQVEEMGSYILSRSNIDEKTFKKNRSKDWYFDADEQVSYVLVDRIVTSIEEIL